MDTTFEEDMRPTYDPWSTPPKKGSGSKLSNDPLLFNSLEESARAIAQASILSYGIRFTPSAIAELYLIIEEGIINMKKLKEENNFSKIAEAEKNLVTFIQEVVTTTKDDGLTTVDAQNVKAVRKLQLCPVYPFT